MKGLYPPSLGENVLSSLFRNTEDHTRSRRRKQQNRTERRLSTHKHTHTHQEENEEEATKKTTNNNHTQTTETVLLYIHVLYTESVASGAGCLAGAPGWGPAVVWVARLGVVERRMRCAFPSVAKSIHETYPRQRDLLSANL